jgi:hypothetical protein
LADGAAKVISHLADAVYAGEVTSEVDNYFDSIKAIVVLESTSSTSLAAKGAQDCCGRGEYFTRVEKTWKLGKLVFGTNVCFQEPSEQTRL